MGEVLRTWDLLCREFCFVCAGDETQALPIQSVHSTPEPDSHPKELLGFSLSEDETLQINTCAPPLIQN